MTGKTSLTDGASQRVEVRKFLETDIPFVMDHLNRADIAQWLAAVPSPFESHHAALFTEAAEDTQSLLYSITVDDRLAGCLSIGVNTWFWLASEFRGQGIMDHALKVAISAYFAQNGPPLYATARADNAASHAVLERMGFSAMPQSRRMFFQSAGTSFACTDYVLATEQWALLHPPVIVVGQARVRPAVQKDAEGLALFLPRTDPWGDDNLLAFIERSRFRGGCAGLFVIHDDNRQMVGAALVQGPDTLLTTFVSQLHAEQLGREVETALRDGLLNP